MTPTVSAMTERTMPGTMPKIRVFAVEKMMAGGKPMALTKSTSQKLKNIAQEPKERMYSAVARRSPLLKTCQSSGKKVGLARWIA